MPDIPTPKERDPLLERFTVNQDGKRRATSHYKVWDSMKQRCLNPKHKSYPNYGGRGIVICQRWVDSFELFIRDMGPRPTMLHTLERKDTNGPYSPENCTWATVKEQARNRRSTKVVLVDGKFRKVCELADEMGVRNTFIHKRLAAGHSIERSIDPRRINVYTGHKGSDHRCAKLTEADVVKIRSLASSGVMLKDIAASYGIRENTTSMIVSRKRWKHVE